MERLISAIKDVYERFEKELFMVTAETDGGFEEGKDGKTVRLVGIFSTEKPFEETIGKAVARADAFELQNAEFRIFFDLDAYYEESNVIYSA